MLLLWGCMMQTLVRKIGNSTGTIIPFGILKKLNLKAGDLIDIHDDAGRIIIVPNKKKPRYSLTELLAQCDDSAPMPEEVLGWERTPDVGNEQW